jgi:hypothetical protein
MWAKSRSVPDQNEPENDAGTAAREARSRFLALHWPLTPPRIHEHVSSLTLPPKVSTATEAANEPGLRPNGLSNDIRSVGALSNATPMKPRVHPAAYGEPQR